MGENLLLKQHLIQKKLLAWFLNNNCSCDNSKSACGTVVKTNKDEIVTVMLDGKKLAEAVTNAINNITVKSNLKI